MSEPWLTQTPSRSDLEAASSISLARSIYGSQVHFDDSSNQGSDFNLFRTNSQVPSLQQSSQRLTRPKSSPASTLAERNRKSRPASAMAGTRGSRSLVSARPTTARPMRGRPASAVPCGSLGNQSHGFLGNPPQQRRPKSAAPWSSSNSLIDVEDIDAPTRSTTRIQSANPVKLTSIPEYMKVWEGKPLLPRDHGNKHFDRKAWQRPKSDYGLRNAGARRSRRSSREEVPSPVLSEVSLSGSHDANDTGATILAWEDDGSGMGNGNGNGNGNSGNGDERDAHIVQGSSGDTNGTGGRHGDKDTRGLHDSGSTNCLGGGSHGDSDLWASRIQPPQEDSSSDDEDLNEKPQDSRWMDYHMALARHSTRFELPMDMKRLQGMTPVEYLSTHCVVSDRRVQHYKRVFAACTRRQPHTLQPLPHPPPAAAATTPCIHGHKELLPALIDAHHSLLSTAEVQRVVGVVCIAPDDDVAFKLFCGVCALTERMYRDKFVSSKSTGAVREYGRRREIVEDADFEALDWKLRGCTISKSLRNLFSQL